jgi:cytochrome c peroxidase
MRGLIVSLLVAPLGLAACEPAVTPPGPPPATLTTDAELRQRIAQWGVLPIGPVPAQDPARVALGRALFFDPILSGSRDVACGTCHRPATGLSDGLSLAVGTGSIERSGVRAPGPGRTFVPRRTPSLLNVGLGGAYLFWDGRLAGFRHARLGVEGGPALPVGLTTALEAQAMLPVLDRREMRGEPGDRDVNGNINELALFADDEHHAIWNAIMKRLLDVPEYAVLFAAAFPGRPAAALGFEHAAMALAAFQTAAFTRTGSPFDRYLNRDDRALTVQQRRGALLFFERARCATCHGGPLLGGFAFANVGAPQVGPGVGRGAPLDLGRGELTDNPFYRFAFRAPPLRNAALRPPYMHSGAYATLADVVRHYDDVPAALRGFDGARLGPGLRDLYHGDAATLDAVLASLAPQLRAPLGLRDDEVRDLIAFLQALTDPAARDLAAIVPAAVPSGLTVPR